MMNEKLKKIGIDAHNLRAGGGITHLVNILEHSDELDSFDLIYVYCNRALANKLASYELKKLVIVTPAELDKSIFHRLYWQQFVLPKIAEEKGLDFLFCPGGIIPFKKISGVKKICMFRNMLVAELKNTLTCGFSLRFFKFLILRYVQMASFRKADANIFISHFAKEKALETFKIDKAKPSAVIYHGVNNIFAGQDSESVKDRKKSEIKKLLYVSTIDVYKHQIEVVKAVEIIRERGYDVCLELIGSKDPATFSKLKKTIEETQMGPFVDVVGFRKYEELPASYRDCDVVLFASTCENCPNILLEAMLSGKPIACSETKPMPEFAGNTVSYFDATTPSSIAYAVIYLLDNPEKAHELASSAKDKVSGYLWKECAKNTFDFIGNLR